MIPEPLFEPVHFQQELDTLRKKENCDFAGVALYENHEPSGPIKWQYVSGNLNNRYKLIVLRKGRRLAGTVMKTGKRMVIENVSKTITPEEKIKYPILMSENLNALVAIPLWHEQHVAGVLLLGQRGNKTLPKVINQLNIKGRLWEFNEEI